MVKNFEFEIDFDDLEEDDVIQVLLAEGKISIYPNHAEEWVMVAGMMPQSRLAQRLTERGIWDLSRYELAPNSYETSASWQ